MADTEERYFSNYAEDNCLRGLLENGRTFDFRDTKWAREEVRDVWNFPAGDFARMYNPDVPMEDRVAAAEAATKGIMDMLTKAGSTYTGDIGYEDFEAPGCPEEPDTPVKVRVYRPKNLEEGTGRVLFYCLGGALVTRVPEMYPIPNLCEAHRCAAVVVYYRTSWEASYPAAINDLHAGYAWMVDNAEMLGIDPDKVVIAGASSGGHLGLSIAFRLKRYGYRPRGVVVQVPQVDDRISEGNAFYSGGWDALSQHHAMLQYMGSNYVSPFVGPEAFANHATVEECIGYPPLSLYTIEFDPDCDASIEFFKKVKRARSYAELCVMGGLHHVTAGGGTDNDLSKRIGAFMDGPIEDFFNQDLRRPWVTDIDTGE